MKETLLKHCYMGFSIRTQDGPHKMANPMKKRKMWK